MCYTIGRHKSRGLNPTHITLNTPLRYHLIKYNRGRLYSTINEYEMTIMGLKMIFSEDVEKDDFIVGYDEFSF